MKHVLAATIGLVVILGLYWYSQDDQLFSAISPIAPVQGGTGTSTVSSNYSGKCLSVSAVSPLAYTWVTCSGSSLGFGSLLGVATSSDATGDVYYLNSSGQIVNLGVGSSNQVLKVSGGLPSWGTDSTGATIGNVATSTSETSGYVPYWTSTSGYPATVGSISSFQFSSTYGRLTVTAASSTLLSVFSQAIFGGTASTSIGSDGVLKLVSGASPTVNAAGEMAWDTTSFNLTSATSTAGSHFVIGSATTTLWAFSVASTSPDFASGGILYFPPSPLPVVVTGIVCFVDGGTSQVINLSNSAGSSDTNSATCSTSATQTRMTTNYSYAAYAIPRLEFGTKTGSPDYLVVEVVGYRTSD